MANNQNSRNLMDETLANLSRKADREARQQAARDEDRREAAQAAGRGRRTV